MLVGVFTPRGDRRFSRRDIDNLLLKSKRSTNPPYKYGSIDLPEFRDYARHKYPDVLDEDGKGVSVNNCPIKLEVCYPSCYWWDRKNKGCTYFDGDEETVLEHHRASGKTSQIKIWAVFGWVMVYLPLDKGKGGDASLWRGEAPLKGISAVSGHH